MTAPSSAVTFGKLLWPVFNVKESLAKNTMSDSKQWKTQRKE